MPGHVFLAEYLLIFIGGIVIALMFGGLPTSPDGHTDTTVLLLSIILAHIMVHDIIQNQWWKICTKAWTKCEDEQG